MPITSQGNSLAMADKTHTHADTDNRPRALRDALNELTQQYSTLRSDVENGRDLNLQPLTAAVDTMHAVVGDITEHQLAPAPDEQRAKQTR
jgi:hypothetical protein